MAKKIYEKLITVAEVVKHLLTLEQDRPMCKVGHFGEIYPIDLMDFSIPADKQTTYQEPINASYPYEDRKYMDVYNVHVPDIGEDPD